jgi:hypothetical protein
MHNTVRNDSSITPLTLTLAALFRFFQQADPVVDWRTALQSMQGRLQDANAKGDVARIAYGGSRVLSTPIIITSVIRCDGGLNCLERRLPQLAAYLKNSENSA